MDITKRPLSTLPLFLLLAAAAPAWAAPPIANNDARTIPQHVAITVNVLSNDSDPDGDGISVLADSVTQPSGGGSVTLNGDGALYYVPPQDQLPGEVRFSYRLVDDSDPAEQSEVAIVILNVVPSSLSTAVPAGNQASVAQALEEVCTQLVAEDTTDADAGTEALTRNCEALLNLEANDAEAAARAVQQIAPEETLALAQLGANASEFQQEIVGNRLSQLSQGAAFAARGRLGWSGQLNGGAAGDGDELMAKVGVFASVQLEDADKKETAAEAGFDYTANAVTVGADYAISKDWYVGSALGWTGNELEYKNDNGKVESHIFNIIAYSTYNRQNFTFDTQIGFGGSLIDLTRHISYDVLGTQFETSTRGETTGKEWFLTMQTQYLWSQQAWTLYPRGSINYSSSTVDGYADTDAAGWDVILSDQTVERWTLETGVQVTYAINTSWGVIVPNADFNIIADIATDQELVTGRFAYAPGGDGFVLGAEEPDSLYYQLGLGFSAIFPRGTSAFAGLRQTLGYSDYRALQVQAGFRIEI